MKTKNSMFKIPVLKLFLFLCGSLTAAAEGMSFAPIKGHWEGSGTLGGGRFSLVADFSAGKTLRATLSFPDSYARFIPAVNVGYEPPRVHFEIPEGEDGTAIFDGILRKKTLEGTIVKGGLTGSFTLKRLQTRPRTGAESHGEREDVQIKSYADAHRGRVIVEIPKAFELFNIVTAITDYGLESPYLIDKEGGYYEEVMRAFLPFRKHPLIAELEFSDAELIEYITMRSHSFFHDYRDGRFTTVDALPPFPADPFDGEMSKLFESFARKTNFEEFYRRHQTFYDRQIAEYGLKVPVKRMWDWLETQFPATYCTYVVVISPLIHGTHNTIRFGPEGSKVCVMFVGGPGAGDGRIDALTEARLSRIVFTEIDHNYVNPITDTYSREVDEALSDVSKWYNLKMQAGVYNSPYLVFNEYSTWMVFLLYARDTYESAVYEEIERTVIRQMEGERGFIRFGAFSDFCSALYGNKGAGEKVVDLFPDMVRWFRDFTD